MTRASIRLGVDESRCVDEVIAALATDPEIYQRNGRLVRVFHFSDEWIQVQSIPRANLRERIVRAADIHRGHLRVHPPEWLVAQVAARGHWAGIRVLRGVIAAAVEVARYDATTETLYLPRASTGRG